MESRLDLEELKKIIYQNNLEIRRHRFTYRHFDFEDGVNYIITGPRGSGKTNLLYQRIFQMVYEGVDWSQICYLNFEDERLVNFTTADLEQIILAHRQKLHIVPHLFLDEIQNIEGWEEFLMETAEDDRLIYVTGSDRRLLNREYYPKLTKFFKFTPFHPISFWEYLRYNDIKVFEGIGFSQQLKREILKFFDRYLTFGSSLDVLNAHSRINVLHDKFRSTYLGDVQLFERFPSVNIVRLTYSFIAKNIGISLSTHLITLYVREQGAKISHHTINKLLKTAKDLFLLYTISNWDDSLPRKNSKKRLYFADHGMVTLYHGLEGKREQMQNLIAIHLIRTLGQEDLVYYYSHDDIEVDFYIPSKSLAIQVVYMVGKEDSPPLVKKSQDLIKLKRRTGCERLLIVSAFAEQVYIPGSYKVEIVPLWKWLLFDSTSPS